jgi:hypothetical protein
MKNIYSLLLLILSFAFTIPLQAREFVGNNNKSVKQLKATAEACSQATGFQFLNVNNVRARINTGGDMWWDLPGGTGAKYFIPSEGTQTSIYAGALWIGGLDINGQLKLAAQRFRQVGLDYWTGPLTIDGRASVESETCAEYDKHFKVTRAEVDLFLAWWASENKEEEYPGYQIPQSFYDWPAHGDVSLGQSYYLAPFKDVDEDGDYDPESGDYPYYDIENELCPTNFEGDTNYIPEPTPEARLGIVEGGILVDQILKGDETLWWVFNDKGDFHTETQGAAIGLEIRAQAFGFATNDVINNMTFYSYEIINRSTFTLTETFFAPWIDTDLGFANDDFVGCDVERGLGYCYNGRAVDGNNEPQSYGNQPPAVGVDFFQGPYLDPDFVDNPKEINGEQVVDESINGINFGNGIVDDERYGMRRFLYHDNNSSPRGDPQVAAEYYNYLRGFWRDNTPMRYGGDAYNTGVVGPQCDFMFPGDSDPWNWGTGGDPPNGGYNTNGKYWTEEESGNNPFDRRFMQSAGPFTLRPGAVNYITVGIPWARANSGGPFASVELLRVVDDKCQSLFNNCFKVIDGPDAPDLSFTELDQSVIFYISNKLTSNNYQEGYEEFDPNIPTSDSVEYDQYYRFEGYQIFQLRDATVGIENIDDPGQARLVAQFDIRNGVGRIINYEDDRSLDALVPKLRVDGADDGIRHSFILTEDAFAEGATQLVNHKQYYYTVLAYAYNNFLTYSQDPGDLTGLLGQQLPYLAGRKNIRTYTVIPHRPTNGAILNTEYGSQPEITRIEGRGNGRQDIEIRAEVVEQILSKPPSDSLNRIGSDNYPIAYELAYEENFGPVNVQIIDPLNVKPGIFELAFDSMFLQVRENVTGDIAIVGDGDTASVKVSNWTLRDLTSDMVYASDTSIITSNEQLFPELGISVNIEQVFYSGPYDVGDDGNGTSVSAILAIENGSINSILSFADSSRPWLTGVPDVDIPGSSINWIKAGNSFGGGDDDMGSLTAPWDPNAVFEGIIQGTWAPYSMTSVSSPNDVNGVAYGSLSKRNNELSNLSSIDVVFTSDKSKWTRCPVIEMQYDNKLAEGNARRFTLRRSFSVDKDGNFATDSVVSENENDPNYISYHGMGWFPGYAIDVETGERLNVIFGEDSWLSQENGRDMIWNPTSTLIDQTSGDWISGGKHYLYILRSLEYKATSNVPRDFYFPAYDAGAAMYEAINWADTASGQVISNTLNVVYSACNWVTLPLLVPGEELLSNDAKVRIRMSRPYDQHYAPLFIPDSIGSQYGSRNNNYPLYSFSTESVATEYENETAFDEDLDMIRVVPNPYYAYSTYETVPLDNRVKITNLPDKCTVTIYTLSGTEIRKYEKDNSTTAIEWDLKNFAGVPIAGGIYLIHIETELNGVNKERVLKWFGMLRKQDLNTF